MLVDDHRTLETEVEVTGPCVAGIGHDLSKDPLRGGVRSGSAGPGHASSLGQLDESVSSAGRSAAADHDGSAHA